MASGLRVLITSHPGKFLFTLLAIGVNLVRLPFWMLYYVPSSLRPHKKWTYVQAIRMQVLKAILQNMSHVEMKTPESFKPGKEGKQFVIIEPAVSSSYVGIVTKDPDVKPKAIGGTWYPAPLEKYSGKENVVVHFHGGAYVIGDGRNDDAGHAAKTILDNTPTTHVLCPQYRLSSNPLGRFPAALQDAITAILHLTRDLDVPAQRVTVSGDSAGGNLCLALLRYIHEQPEAQIPSPTAALLWSPWVDPGGSLIAGTFDNAPNAKTDYLPEDFGAWGAREYLPSKASGLDLSSPYIQFPGNPFSTPTALFFATGDCEVLFHDDVKVYEEFKGVPGNKCELMIEENVPHDILLTAPLNGFGAEAIVTAKAAGRFLEGLER